MDQISRRSFLKGAGMTALAVAAVGMMTGCKGEDFVPDPQKVDVAVIFCKFGGAVENNLPSDKIQVVEKAAKEGQAVDKAEIEKLLAGKKGWKLDDYDPGDLKVHPSEDSVGIEDLALAVKVAVVSTMSRSTLL
jgi:anaerobic selenocysteine-containing dehydrogenase